MRRIIFCVVICVVNVFGVSAQLNKSAKIEGRPSAEVEIKDANRIEKERQQKQLMAKPELLEKLPTPAEEVKRKSVGSANKNNKYVRRNCVKKRLKK